MLTASEVLFLKDLIEQLASLSDASEYTENEVDEALELLEKVTPIKTEDYLQFTKENKSND